MERPERHGEVVAGCVMGMSYFLGGLIPMIPYFAMRNVSHALYVSIAITAVVLVVFGYVKAMITGTTRSDRWWSAVQTLVVGVAAAGTSYGIVRGVSSVKSLH
ncbi:MAG: hypothetical protein M1820_004562 [Bogoriella megaspora]|nr:MAG: hypothetical protein M1820_004562 [Bogoriella megaspora]